MNDEFRTFLTLKYPTFEVATDYSIEIKYTVHINFTVESGESDGYFFTNSEGAFGEYVIDYEYFPEYEALLLIFCGNFIEEPISSHVIFPDFTADLYSQFSRFLPEK